MENRNKIWWQGLAYVYKKKSYNFFHKELLKKIFILPGRLVWFDFDEKDQYQPFEVTKQKEINNCYYTKTFFLTRQIIEVLPPSKKAITIIYSVLYNLNVTFHFEFQDDGSANEFFNMILDEKYRIYVNFSFFSNTFASELNNDLMSRIEKEDHLLELFYYSLYNNNGSSDILKTLFKESSRLNGLIELDHELFSSIISYTCRNSKLLIFFTCIKLDNEILLRNLKDPNLIYSLPNFPQLLIDLNNFLSDAKYSDTHEMISSLLCFPKNSQGISDNVVRWHQLMVDRYIPLFLNYDELNLFFKDPSNSYTIIKKHHEIHSLDIDSLVMGK